MDGKGKVKPIINSGSIVKEAYSVSQMLFEQFLSKNYNICFEIYEANKIKTLEVLRSFELTEMKFPWNLSTQTNYYKGFSSVDETEVLVLVDIKEFKGDCEISIYTQTLESMHLIYNTLFEKAVKDFIKKNEVIISFTDFVLAGGQVQESSKRLKKETYNFISEKYYPFLNMENFIHEFLTRQENILVLTGETGTGKTKFSSLILKYALNNYNLIEDCLKLNNNYDEDEEDDEYGDREGSIDEKEKEIKVGYLKNEDILALDQFWSLIKNKRFDFIILDDIDYMLLPRTREVDSTIDINRSKFISQLLSYTDGMIPNSTKFIITSNKTDKEIDKALMRPGRMFDILSFRQLEKEEALNIWLNFELKEELFQNYFENHFETEETISQAELGSLIYQTRLKSSRKSYIIEDNISITKKAIKASNKKIGIKSNTK